MNAHTETRQGIIPAAYIAVTGERYRVRVPVTSIWLRRAEGPVALCREWTFPKWHDANWQLLTNSKSAPKGGGYDKHDFRITWADGFEYVGRYDLTGDEGWPELQAQVRRYLNWVATESRRMEWITDEDRAKAADLLATHDMGQSSPSPAPEGWPVVRDYRSEPVHWTPSAEGYEKPEPPLEAQLYGLA